MTPSGPGLFAMHPVECIKYQSQSLEIRCVQGKKTHSGILR